MGGIMHVKGSQVWNARRQNRQGQAKNTMPGQNHDNPKIIIINNNKKIDPFRRRMTSSRTSTSNKAIRNQYKYYGSGQGSAAILIDDKKSSATRRTRDNRIQEGPRYQKQCASFHKYCSIMLLCTTTINNYAFKSPHYCNLKFKCSR